MTHQTNRQPALRQRAEEILRGLSAAEREELLIKCWMSHDARWFMAVAQQFGVDTANRLNQTAAHAEGIVEAQRIVRALQLQKPATVGDYLAIQETLITFLGPDLLNYRVLETGDDSYRLEVQRCFAYDNVVRAGIADSYECGIFARVTGWFDALGIQYEMTPQLGKCMKVQGRECGYAFRLKM